MNIFDFAIRMEQEGQAFYEKMAREASLPGLQTIFASLARDEEKHCDIFLALKREPIAVAMEESTALETARGVFDGLRAAAEEGTIKGDVDAYRYAMQIEAESFRLYEDAASREEQKPIRDLLLRIAGEEHQHFNILENLHAFVNAPSQYLAWGEFSNLDEFRNFGRAVDR